MTQKFTKADRQQIRRLAELAWDRELRSELLTIGDAIQQLATNDTSPHDVADLIHKFHEGISRTLYRCYSDSLPWLGVCGAFLRGVLTDDDLAAASDQVRNGLHRFAEVARDINEADD